MESQSTAHAWSQVEVGRDEKLYPGLDSPTNAHNHVAALALHGERPRISPKLGEIEISMQGDIDGFKYELRPCTREVQVGLSSAWLDDDQTGDYDPQWQRNRPRPPPKKRRKVMCSDTAQDDTLKSSHEIPQILVKFCFSSEAGRSKFAAILVKSPVRHTEASTCPEETYNLRKRTGDKGSLDPQITHRATTDCSNQAIIVVGHPAARGCHECLELGERCNLLDNEFEWPCRTCAQDCHDCNLVLQPTRKQPCSNCISAGKREKWLVCSFVHDSDHSTPCKQCQANGIMCRAGPDPAFVHHRIRYGDDGQPFLNPRPLVKPVRVPASCMHCQEAQRICSLDRGCGGGSCTSCEMLGLPCKPLGALSRTKRDVPAKEDDSRKGNAIPRAKEPTTGFTTSVPPGQPQAGRTSLIAAPAPAENQKRQPNKAIHQVGATRTLATRMAPTRTEVSCVTIKPKENMRAETSRIENKGTENSRIKAPQEEAGPTKLIEAERLHDSGQTKIITTNFAHPMLFGREGACPFCSGDRCLKFAILGLGRRKVLVKELSDGRGYKEISGGHRADGVFSTTMCFTCTSRRLEIIKCPDHRLRPILGANPTDTLTALDDLLHNRNTQVWCSLCCNTAVYECAPRPIAATAAVAANTKGCGLCLCEDCALALNRDYRGSLQALLHGASAKPSMMRKAGFRADSELLRDDGVLLMHVTSS